MKKLVLLSLAVVFANACATQTSSTDSTSNAAGMDSASATGDHSMSFFISSVGGPDGANYGGLAGADAHCQKLAAAAGAGSKTWHAYLSTSGKLDFANPANNVPAVNARDRIGKGPWFNAKGEMIAKDLAQLHSHNNITKQTALDEKGELVNGRGDKPNMHDILTGSRADGTAFAPFSDTTCHDWTSNNEGSAIVGHHDRNGPNDNAWSKSWNFAHPSAGCSPDGLKARGGAGLLYCFAVN